MKTGKYEHLFQKTKSDAKIVKKIEEIEAQNWKVGYFILMGSFLIGMTVVTMMIKLDTLTLFYGWETNLAAIFLFAGAILAGFFGSGDFGKSALMTAITIGIINYAAVIVYEVYPAVATEQSSIQALIFVTMIGIPALSFMILMYLMLFGFIGTRIWDKVTSRFPRYV